MSDKAELTTLNEQYIAGLANSDVAWFQQRLIDEFVCIEADGLARDKSSFLRKVADGPSFVTYQIENVSIRIYGQVGLVQATGAFTRTDGSAGRVHYIDVYARLNDEWRVVSAQITRAREPATQIS